MIRESIPLLADDFHLVAPDLSGFGLSALPSPRHVTYSFNDLAEVVSRSKEVIGLDRYGICDFDCGVPTGLPVAMANPDRVTTTVKAFR